jgi:hypothetical protein
MDQVFNNTSSSKAVINSALVFFWVSFLLLMYVILLSLVAIITGQANYGRAIPTLLASIIGLSIVMTVPLQVVNQYNRVRVTKEGLYIEVYIFRYLWKFVNWKDVMDLRLTYRPDRWGKPLWLVTVRNLTYWHRLISQQHHLGSYPGILISSDLVDREKLLTIIEERLNKPKKASS